MTLHYESLRGGTDPFRGDNKLQLMFQQSSFRTRLVEFVVVLLICGAVYGLIAFVLAIVVRVAPAHIMAWGVSVCGIPSLEMDTHL